jgi:ribosomal protein S18 acetylase RimI-like enzyme
MILPKKPEPSASRLPGLFSYFDIEVKIYLYFAVARSAAFKRPGRAPFRRGRSELEFTRPGPDNAAADSMNVPGDPKSIGDPPPVSLRPEQPEDEGLLFDIYASTREEELVLTNWDEPMRRAFLTQQFNAMRQGYRSMFPTGQFMIIELDGRAVGRMVLHRGASGLHVVDLALLPAYRDRGIGTLLLRRVCAEAANAGKPVRLCVLKNNRAFHWYERLGFVKTGERGIYDELEWRSPSGAGLISPAG